MSEGTVLILLIPKSVQLPEKAEAVYAGARISSLMKIHKALSRCSLDWEVTTIDAERPAIINDDPSEKAREWLRNYEEKLVNAISLDEIRPADFCSLIVPNCLGILGFYEKSPIYLRLGALIQEFETKPNTPILTIGLGIAAGLSCKNTSGNWIWKDYSLTSISVPEMYQEPYFANLELVVEDQIRNLGGRFCPGKPEQHLVIVDRNLVTAHDDFSAEYAAKTLCILLGY